VRCVALIAGLAGLAGCDKLFSLETVPQPPIDAPEHCLMAIGHDDDGDCIPDDVDLCPGVPDPAQGDADHDMIGDACDPDPTKKGNQLLLFVPNTDPVTLADWQHNGAWAIINDALANGDTTQGIEDWAYYNHVYPAGLEIQTIVHIDEPGELTHNVGLGYAIPPTQGGSPPTADEWSCSVLEDTKGVHLDLFAGGAPSEPIIPQAMFVAGAVFTLRLRVEATKISCTIQGATPAQVQAATSDPGAVPPMAQPALYTAQAAGHFDSMAVYSLALAPAVTSSARSPQ